MRRIYGGIALVLAVILLAPAVASADFTVPAPPITVGVLSVDGISINGHAGNTLTVAPGADVQITGTATDHNPCQSCIMYANAAFRGAAASAGCFGGLMRLDMPGFATATGTVNLGNAPTTLGYYDIVAEDQSQFSCGAGWSAAGGTTIAQIWVQPTAFTVPAPPIAAGGGQLSISNVSLNGHAGNTITVPVGSGHVQITATAHNTAAPCAGCVVVSNTAFAGSPSVAGCFGAGTVGNDSSNDTETGTVDLGNAPTKPGFYDVIIDPEDQFNCGDNWQNGAGTTIAQVRVTPLPTCPPVTSATPFATPVDVTLACSGASALSYSVAPGGAPAHGTLGAIAGNRVRYTPAAGFSGTDVFRVRATDAFGGTAVETVTMHVGAKPAPKPKPTPLPLTCSGKSITLLQVGISGRKVALAGLTLSSAAGKTVSLVAHPGGTVGTAVVDANGVFAAKVRRPSAKTLAKVRYEAVLGTAHSSRFKLLRQFTITSTKTTAAGTTIKAQLNGRVAKHTTLTVYRQLTCSTRTVFKRIHIPRSKKVKVTFPPPPSSDPVAYYRLVVKVARNGTSRPATATLPVAVTVA